MTWLTRSARRLLHPAGLPLSRHATRRGARILMYHRFPAAAAGLDAQCAHLRAHYRPVSLDEIVAHLVTGEPLPPRAVAVTIDDGYRDFLEAAAVFRRYEIPTTVFVVSDFLDGEQWLWGDVVDYALRRTRRPVRLDRRRFCEPLKNVPTLTCQRAVEALVRELEVVIPARPCGEYAPLTWDEARRLTRDGVAFGAHTRTHPILSQLESRDQIVDEVRGSKQRIEARVGQPVRHFCYPNGRPQDVNAEVVDVVRESGFHGAVTTERGLNYRGAVPLLLRRLGVEPDLPMPYFSELLAGVRAQ